MGIRLKSHMTMRLSSGAILKAIPNGSGNYAVLAVSYASNVNIVGGTIQGERAAHTGSDGEWGMGLSISNSHHVMVEGVTAKDCWGDGFYITDDCSDVTLCNVVADHNRRQGLSITSVDGMVVRNSTFKNTTGTQPEAGIDIEPNSGQTVANLLITGSICTNNSGGGLQSGPPVAYAGRAFLVNVVIDGNTFSDNGVNSVDGSIRDGVMVANCDGVQIMNNTIANNTGRGILLRDKATHTLISGNTVTGTISISGQSTWSGGGIYLGACAYSTITGNTVTGNAGYGIWQPVPDESISIKANIVSGNGRKP
jgi:parallel beta-helix repeat protein